MQLKGYFSGTVEAAMELARKELGEDALLVNARPAVPETRYLGSYEVVFGVTNGATTPRAPGRPPGAGLAERPADSGGLAKEFAELKREFQKMAQKLELETPTPAALANTPSDPLYSRLIERDLDPALARMVVEGAPIESLFETDSTLGVAAEQARSVVALVGPPGREKLPAW